MRRWILFFIVLLVGTGLGLLYGWVLNPVDYLDTTFQSLREDYQTDYVLMVAEVYHAEQDLAWARTRLTMLGEQPPQQSVEEALAFAEEVGYTARDLALMEELRFALAEEE
jgi:hypothetical protein